TALASLLVGAAFFSLWFWLLPQWLGFRVETAGAAQWKWLAAIPSVLGFAVALRCVWDFGWTVAARRSPSLRHNAWSLSVFIATFETLCMLASPLAGSDSGSSSDTPISTRFWLHWQSRSEYICS